MNERVQGCIADTLTMLLIAFSYEAASERKPQITNKENTTPIA